MKKSDKVNALRAEMISEIIKNVKTIYKKLYNETPVDGNYILDFSDITTRDIDVIVEDNYGHLDKVLLDGIDVSENDIHFTSVDDLGDYFGEIYPDELNTDILSWIADIIENYNR